MNLFATVLTYPAPSANYRGESEMNRSVIQKVTDGRFDYPIISPEAIRNALREILAKYGLPSNRKRMHPVSGKGKSDDGAEADKQQLAVKYSQYPEPNEFADDFLFGYLLAVKGAELTKLRAAKGDIFPMKRDSILRMNLAKALDEYRHNAVFTQSPQFAEGNPWKPGGGETKSSSALLHRETVVSAFQYPFALNSDDCLFMPPGRDGIRPMTNGALQPHPHGREWTRSLLRAIGELNGVAGNHARSYFEMAPASIIVRLSTQLVAGYETYGFKTDGTFPEVVEGILHEPTADYPGNEFYLGGKIVKRMDAETAKRLEDLGVTLDRDPRRLLERVAETFLGS